MSRFSKSVQAMFDLRSQEDMAYLNSPLHRWHPSVKLIVTVTFIIKTAATPSLQYFVLIKLLMILMAAMVFGKLSFGQISRRTIPGIMFVMIFGATYFFGYAPQLAGLMFVGILLKAYLTLGMVLVSVATSGIDGIGEGLAWLHVPRLVIMQLQLTYRYLGRFMDRVTAMSLSHQMRGSGRGIGREAWGSFLGHLFLGAMADAQMVQQAMALRGYHINDHRQQLKAPEMKDWVIGVFLEIMILL